MREKQGGAEKVDIEKEVHLMLKLNRTSSSKRKPSSCNVYRAKIH